MIMRWFIGLVFLCLSLVAHGREVEPNSGADLALSPYKDEIAAGDNVILKEVVAGVQALQVTSSLVVTPAAFAKSAQNFTKVQSVLRSADKLTSATKLKTAKLIQGLQDFKSACWGLMGSHASKLGSNQIINFTGFSFNAKRNADKFIDIIIHSTGTDYVVIEEGLSTTKTLEELATVIDGVPAGYTARLLSCNDEAAALKLSEFCEKPFYASHGRVDVNKSGEVFTENDFYLFSNGQKGSTEGSGYSLGTAKGTEGVDFVRLGDVVTGAGNFDEFLTVGGKVKKAGNKPELFSTFIDNTKVPSRYTTNENRFNALATDNATGVNKIDVKTRREAMAGLEAEQQGLLKGPITREPTGDFEFIDADGKYWDVKSPPSQGLNTPSQIQTAGNSIKSQLTVPNVKVILDCTWMTEVQLTSLRQWLNTNLTPQQLDRIVEVNSNLF